MCTVSFCILFIWVCLIISIPLDLVLRQFRFSLSLFNLSSRFFVRDYVKAAFHHFVLLWSFLSLCLDSLHVLYRLAGFRFCQRSKYKPVRHCDCNFNQIVQFINIIKLICISSILFSIYFQWIWQGEFVKQSRVLKLMIISFILVTFLFYSGVIL